MEFLSRFGRWWSDQWRTTNKVGKLAMLVVPLFLGCCGMTMLSALVSPDAEPTAEPAGDGERLATVDIAENPPTAEPPTSAPTDEPTPEPATATPRPSATRPPASPVPTAQPTAEPPPTDAPVQAATSVAATVAASQPTTAPPTAAPVTVAPTAAPATVAPTQEILPTATQPVVTASGDVVISSIRYDGDVPQVESDEFAVITNRGATAVNLGGWRLNAGEPDQNFNFPSFELGPGQSCRVYTNEIHADSCGGGSFGRGDAIWRNSTDCGYLYNADGAEVSRFCW